MKDAPQELIPQVLRQHFELLTIINDLLGNKLSSPIVLSNSLETQFWLFPKDLLNHMTSLIISHFCNQNKMTQLLQTVFGDRKDTRHFQLGFLLTLARSPLGETNGLHLIRKHLGDYLKKRSANRSTSPSPSASSSSISGSEIINITNPKDQPHSNNFIDSTLEELCIKVHITTVLYDSAMKEKDEEKINSLLGELNLIRSQICAISLMFQKNPSFIRKAVSEEDKERIKNDKKFWCASCKRILFGGYVLLNEQERLCRICFKS